MLVDTEPKPAVTQVPFGMLKLHAHCLFLRVGCSITRYSVGLFAKEAKWSYILTADHTSTMRGSSWTLEERWTSSCSTAALLHAHRLFLRVPSLTHHTWVFIYILFLFLCLGNMNSLFSVTDCSDSVLTQLKTNTVHCRVWMSKTWLLDTNWREIKSLGGGDQGIHFFPPQHFML